MSHSRGRWQAAAALSLVGALALSACSSGQEVASTDVAATKNADGVIRIAYLQKQGDQQYFVDQADGAKAAAKELNAEVTVVNLGDDANKAISEIETAVAQGFDAIAIVVPDQKVGPQVIAAAKAAGIPLIASDDVIMDEAGNEAPFVGFDGTAMGELVGTKAGELFKEAGWNAADTRILRVSKEDLSACEDRVNGATKTFASASGAEVEVIKVGTDATVIDSQNKTGAIVTANPDVKNWVVYGCNDESETGAVDALANAGFGADKVIGVGLGAYLTCKDWNAGKETGNKAALYISGTEVGRTAVETLVKAVREGAELPAKSIAKTAMVDATNWESEGVVCL